MSTADNKFNQTERAAGNQKDNGNGGRKRSTRGHSMVEFATALIALISFVFVPLVSLGMIPVRYLIAQGVLTELSHKLVLCDKRSGAYDLFWTDPWPDAILSRCGIKVENETLNLRILGQADNSATTVGEGQMISAEWLPNGAKGPCIYSMRIDADFSVEPVFKSCPGIPGLTSPVTFKVHCDSPWENLGRDPITSQYFVNE